MFKLNINRSLRASIAVIITAIFLSACSPFSILKTKFKPKEIAAHELNLKRDLYYANAESMREKSSFRSDLESFEIEGVITDSKVSKGFKKMPPSKVLNFTGRVYIYESSFLERILGGAKDFRCFYEINLHSRKVAMPSLIAPQIYDYQCGK